MTVKGMMTFARISIDPVPYTGIRFSIVTVAVSFPAGIGRLPVFVFVCRPSRFGDFKWVEGALGPERLSEVKSIVCIYVHKGNGARNQSTSYIRWSALIDWLFYFPPLSGQ